MLKLLQSNTYYEPTTCEACSKPTNWGEVINCKIFVSGDLRALGYKHICPECYKKAVDISKRYEMFEEV